MESKNSFSSENSREVPSLSKKKGFWDPEWAIASVIHTLFSEEPLSEIEKARLNQMSVGLGGIIKYLESEKFPRHIYLKTELKNLENNLKEYISMRPADCPEEKERIKYFERLKKRENDILNLFLLDKSLTPKEFRESETVKYIVSKNITPIDILRIFEKQENLSSVDIPKIEANFRAYFNNPDKNANYDFYIEKLQKKQLIEQNITSVLSKENLDIENDEIAKTFKNKGITSKDITEYLTNKEKEIGLDKLLDISITKNNLNLYFNFLDDKSIIPDYKMEENIDICIARTECLRDGSTTKYISKNMIQQQDLSKDAPFPSAIIRSMQYIDVSEKELPILEQNLHSYYDAFCEHYKDKKGKELSDEAKNRESESINTFLSKKLSKIERKKDKEKRNFCEILMNEKLEMRSKDYYRVFWDHSTDRSGEVPAIIKYFETSGIALTNKQFKNLETNLNYYILNMQVAPEIKNGINISAIRNIKRKETELSPATATTTTTATSPFVKKAGNSEYDPTEVPAKESGYVESGYVSVERPIVQILSKKSNKELLESSNEDILNLLVEDTYAVRNIAKSISERKKILAELKERAEKNNTKEDVLKYTTAALNDAFITYYLKKEDGPTQPLFLGIGSKTRERAFALKVDSIQKFADKELKKGTISRNDTSFVESVDRYANETAKNNNAVSFGAIRSKLND